MAVQKYVLVWLMYSTSIDNDWLLISKSPVNIVRPGRNHNGKTTTYSDHYTIV